MQRQYQPLSLENGKELYALSEETIGKHFCNFFPNDKLYLFAKHHYDLIPDGLIVEKITSKLPSNSKYYLSHNPASYNRIFCQFKYEENYFNNQSYESYKIYDNYITNIFNMDPKEEYLFIGINLNYTYDEAIIKSIIE